MDLAEFVAARLDELAEADWHVMDCSGMPWPDGHCCDTQRWLARDVAAKRAILDRHMPHETAFDGPACNWCSEDVDDRPQLWKQPWPCPDARSLAAVWNDHPDYRQEWAPAPATLGS